MPQAAFHNGALVYGAISSINLPAGGTSPANGAPYDQPGGTMYRPGSNEIYYPQGSVWGTVRRAHFVSFDAHALAYGLDSATPWAAGDALAQHVAGQHALVANNGTGDGRTYSFDPVVANSQENYNGREEYAASQLAAGWLALYVSKNAWDKTFNLPPLNRSTYAPAPAADAGPDRLVRGHHRELQPGRRTAQPLGGRAALAVLPCCQPVRAVQ